MALELGDLGLLLLLFLFLLAAWADRQIWASRPSTWRRPFLTFGPS